MTQFLGAFGARVLFELGTAFDHCRSRLACMRFPDELSNELFSLVRLEQARKAVPHDRAANILLRLPDTKIPAELVDECVRACRRHVGMDFSLLVAVVGGRLHDKHRESFLAVCSQLKQNLRQLRRKQVTLNEAFTRTDYLLSLLKFVDGDARHRAFPALYGEDELISWVEVVRKTTDRENDLPVGLICNLLGALRDLDDKTHFVKNLSFWCVHSRHASSLELLGSLLTVVRSSPRGFAELLDAYTVVSEAVRRAYPTPASLLDYIGGSNPDAFCRTQAKTFGDRCGLVARVLFNLGLADEYEQIFAKLLSSIKQGEARLKLAHVLLNTKWRWSAVRGAKILEEAAAEIELNPKKIALLMQSKMVLADWHGLRSVLDKALTEERSISKRKLYAAYRALGDLDAAEQVRGAMLKKSVSQLVASPSVKTFWDFIFWHREGSELSFLQESNRQLEVCESPANPKGVIVVLCPSYGDLVHIPLLALAEAKKLGYAVVSLFPGVLRFGPTNIPQIDSIHAQVGQGELTTRWNVLRGRSANRLLNKWQIDLEHKTAVCEGIDLFQGIHEALCCEFRRYSIDYSHPLIKMRADRRIFEMDLMVSSILELKRISQQLNLPIRLLAARHHMSGEYAARFITQKHALEADIGFLASQSGYDNYYSNFREELSNTIAVQDLTRHPIQSRSASVSQELFEKWYAEKWEGCHSEQQTLDVVCQNRLRRENAARGKPAQLLKRLSTIKAQGRSVVALFGKVLFDLGVPYDGGPAHRDMRDWFDHCCELAKENQDIILLVKPHPHEVRNEIALFPSEMLRDWLPRELPENIIYLEHDLLNVYEMSGILDLAVVWNSTVSLELGILGVPCVVCSWYGAIDYPVGHFVPRGRSDFANLVRKAKKLKPRTDIRSRCMALIEYLRSEEVATPYRYTVREVTNKRARRQGWLREDLARYQREGDKYVALLAKRIEESFSARELGGVESLPWQIVCSPEQNSSERQKFLST